LDEPHCKLTLVYPMPAADHLLELMLRAGPAGYTTWHAEGHDQAFDTASANEKVRGRVARGVLVAILARSALPNFLKQVRADVGIPHVAYWVEPVEQFDHLM
jgi:hypothetical protein